MNGPSRFAALALAGVLTGCTAVSADDEVADLLVKPAQLPGQWESQDDDGATELAGGFCDLRSVVEGTQPAEQAVAVLVDGDLLVRDTRLRYEEGAREAYDVLNDRLAECGADPESRRLKLSVEPLAVAAPVDGRSDGYRLRVPVAGTVLLLDLVVWRQGTVLGLTRLTHPQETPDSRALLGELVRVAQENAVSDPAR